MRGDEQVVNFGFYQSIFYKYPGMPASREAVKFTIFPVLL
jgi:hypothetical protein